MTAAALAPVLIFDFDGTIADSFDAVLAAYNGIAPRLGTRPIEPESLPRLRAMKPRAVMREYAVSLWKLPLLVHMVRAKMSEHMHTLEPCPGVVAALGELTANGHQCSILSTNSSQNIRRFLHRHQLTCFQHVAGGVSTFGKARALKRLLQRARIDPRSTFYVGDEARDVHAAARANVRSVAVSWGWTDRTALTAARPDHLVDRPEELVALMTAQREGA